MTIKYFILIKILIEIIISILSTQRDPYAKRIWNENI